MDHACMFEERVSATPLELTRMRGTLDDLILEKLQGKLEGKCSRNGYVIPGSLKLVSRSMGAVEKGTFTGDWVFIVQAEGRVIYPPDGIVIEGTVSRKNKACVYIIYKDAVRIMIPRDLYVGDEEYENIIVGDRVRVEIKKSRFQVNDREILSVGHFRGKVTGGPSIEESEGTAETSAESSAEAASESKSQEEEEEEASESKSQEEEEEAASESKSQEEESETAASAEEEEEEEAEE